MRIWMKPALAILEYRIKLVKNPEREAWPPLRMQAAWSALTSADGILVPGGFGSRGVEGMILAAKFARESQRPYLGICLGMQASPSVLKACSRTSFTPLQLLPSASSPMEFARPCRRFEEMLALR